MHRLLGGKPRMLTAVLIIVALGALALPAASAAPARTFAPGSSAALGSASTSLIATSKAGTMTSVVRGTFGKAGVVRGTFKPARFIVSRGHMYAYGVLHATLLRGNGTLVGHATRHVTLPVRQPAMGSAASGTASGASLATSAASCQILNLVLGPLDLNLLGLKVHLNKVVLNITAVPGAGNLLGNLLCAVAGLLDNTGLLGMLQLSNLLNSILNVLSVV
jgi:hypothetical protein